MTPEQYLLDVDGSCYCLITNVPDSTVESYILGEPWFKTVIVTFDYDASYIEIYNKSDSVSVVGTDIEFQVEEVIIE